MCYSYSCSKGAFAGVSIEGSLLTTRSDVNLNFYGEGSPLGLDRLQWPPVMVGLDSRMQQRVRWWDCKQVLPTQAGNSSDQRRHSEAGLQPWLRFLGAVGRHGCALQLPAMAEGQPTGESRDYTRQKGYHHAERRLFCGAGRPLTAKQLLTSNNVSPPVAAEALYAALDDLMARAGALTAERRWATRTCLRFLSWPYAAQAV